MIVKKTYILRKEQQLCLSIGISTDSGARHKMVSIDILNAIAGVVGGIGIFLLAISLLTQGLQMVSGKALQNILGNWTKSPLRGIGLGIAVTALLQSSSAVTAITIGLVNASIVTFVGAIWVIFGSNIGTTLTGWLVSITGFDFDIKAFALPIIGMGMILKTFSWRWYIGAVGTALTGFGLFFVGVDILKESFSVFSANPEFSSIEQSGFWSIVMLVGIGFAMTVMTQSSSAATALILTGTAGGMLTLSGGAAMVIGANLGTTSTAALAVIGASANAKRAAAAHVLFNGITGIVALIMMPFLLSLIIWLERSVLHIPTTPVISLALFHTLFNVTGVLLLSPFVPRMSRFLEKRFVTTAEKEGKPQFLDNISINMPALAVNTLIQELVRFKTLSCQNALNVFVSNGDDRFSAQWQEKRDALYTLSAHIIDFAGNLSQEKAPEDITAQIHASLRVTRYLREISVLSTHGRDAHRLLKSVRQGDAVAALKKFLAACSTILTDLSANVPLSESAMTDFIAEYHTCKDTLLACGAHRKISIDELSQLLDSISPLRRMIEQAIKADRHLILLTANKR